MEIIKKHDITLYGSTGELNIVLRPLCDDHLPLLYKWNADPEILYWDGSDDEAYDAETVHHIYGTVSNTTRSFCFLIEAEGVPVGECWLQKMNLQAILDKYPEDADVRRIDMIIGEKAYWNRGIGSTFIRMLVDFAFDCEGVEYLHGSICDFNTRSQRVFEKNGFTLFLRESSEDAPSHGKEDFHYRITKDEFIKRKQMNNIEQLR